jgi:tripartite-type tricarboxylate transporter receptor subunit TctC
LRQRSAELFEADQLRSGGNAYSAKAEIDGADADFNEAKAAHKVIVLHHGCGAPQAFPPSPNLITVAQANQSRLTSAENASMLTRRTIVAGCGIAAAAPLVPAARAQVVRKPVHIIVGFPAGGGTDVIARILAERLRGAYAATVIVENKPGGAARVAIDAIKSAEPDGSEILFTPDFPITIYPHSFRSLSYDPLRDLVPVAPVASGPLTYNIGPAVPDRVTSLAAFVEWCKANPDKALYATTAAGGTPHFIGVMFAAAAGLKMTPVHYRGGAPALQDLVGGHVPASINPMSEALPLANSGRLRILAVSSTRRSQFVPDVPTIRQAGYDVVVDTWLGVFLPAGALPEIVRALSAAIADAVKSPEMVDSLAKFGSEPRFQPPDAFAATVKADTARWGPVVKASGFVAEE